MNLFMFGIPAMMWVAFAWVAKVDVSVSAYQFVIILILAVFFSYLGNKLSLKGIEYAPNPGYSLVISKSYVVMTAIAAIFLFGSPLTAKAALAILLIVFFSALITIDKKGIVHPKHVHARWLPLSVGAFFCWGMLSLTSKYLLDIGVGTLPRLLYSMGLVTIFIVIEIIRKRRGITIPSISQAATLVGIGLSSAGFNWFMQEGFRTAPNIGYINAMNASSMGLVVIGAAIFFRDDMTPRKLIGVFGVIAGLILLVL